MLASTPGANGGAPPGAGSVPTAAPLAEAAHAILVARCLHCHGGVREKAGLNLAHRDRALMPNKDGQAAIVPGDSGRSALLERVASHDSDQRMPADGAPLTAAEVDTLTRWIQAGAPYPVLWSLAPVVSPALPEVRGATWCANDLDRFTAARLEGAGIALPALADRRTLLRRASLDLCGLPPEPAEVDAYVADASPQAWERAVDRLLASPAYGERWARVWLDLARYADTRGYEKDARREIWRFRDWLIDAFNADMPYDAFTQRLLAGDLLPGATEEDRVATAFHRNTLTNDEGGTDDEEFRTAAVMDRNATTWNVWLGASMQCVQCHSHPYDLIDHRDYYRSLAFFNQSADADREDDAPTMKLRWGGGETAVPVMEELPSERRRETHVFVRGNWRAHGERVEQGTPDAMPLFGAELPRDRLGLARWIASPENPRCARVEVNRLWETLFGRGIVETSEDFGAAGMRPMDAPMLDWLAARFVAEGWSRKQLLRTIVCSATYRMSALPTADALARDPDNRLMSRAPRVRLEAEAVRDQALAVSGLLDRTLHGPPVFPLQPDGVWMVVYNGEAWKASEGGDRWRRALYTFWRRSSPHPSLMAFDAVSRETCTIRRIRTNTPLAALAAENDPTYMECARGLALRSLAVGGGDRAIALAMLERALVRVPTEQEVERLAALAADERLRFRTDAGAAAQVAGECGAAYATGTDETRLAEVAAWTMAATVLLNLDEFLTRT